MDRSIQVNFPIVGDDGGRRAIRKQTSYDSALKTNRSLQALNAWPRPSALTQRPKSLNLSTETYHRSKISFLSETSPRNSYPPSENSVSISRERTPPPTYVVTPITIRPSMQVHKKQPQQDQQQQQYEGDRMHNGAGICRCFFQDPVNSNGPPNPTPEGLSWRRLHMSRAKLKATSTTSELLSGFAMVAMVELQINEPTKVPEWLFIMFAVCTTVLVSVHIFALMISTYILPNIDAISKLDICELVSESPHERMRGFIEIAWAFSTVLGLFLFLVEVAILCWVKFYDYSVNAAIASTIIVIPVLVIFILFAVHFYHSLLSYRCDTSVHDIQKLEELKKNLDEASTDV